MFIKADLQGNVLAFPYTYKELRTDNPNTSFPPSSEIKPEGLPDFDFYPVALEPKPVINTDTQAIEQATPVLTDGAWSVGWVVTNLTTAEIDAAVDLQVVRSFETGPAARAISFTLADIWQQINPTLTTAQARAQIRNRLEANLREIKGL